MTLDQIRTAPATDEALMKRYYDGSGEAFDELSRRWRPRLFAYFRSRGVAPHDAEDLIQDVYVKVACTRHTPAAFDPARSFYPWLFRIAHHAMVSLQRRGSRLAEPPPRGDAETDPEQWLEALRDPGVPPEQGVIAVEFLQAVRDCFTRISGTLEGEALWHWCAGATQQELAQTVARSVATVCRIVNRAAEACRRCLQEKGYDAMPDVEALRAWMSATEKRKRG